MKALSKLMINLSLALALVAFFSNYSFAQDTGDDSNTHGSGFVDENGDGFNDNAPDADGDGIPNGMDEDYVGSKMHNGQNKGHGSHGFIDEDGDGIPNGQDPDYVRSQDGSGNQHKYGNSGNHQSKHQHKHMKGSQNSGGGMGDGSQSGNAHQYRGSKKHGGHK